MTQKQTTLRPNIYEYDNYRKWLKDLYEFYKSTTSYFSYRYFAKRAGFTSPNYLKLVIEGDRNLSFESVKKFEFALKLTQNESKYFRSLVGFNQAKKFSEKSKHAQSLLRSRSLQKVHPLKAARYRYYAHWYSIAIRELIGTSTFVEDPISISKKFRFTVTPDEVSRAIDDLLKLNLIFRDDQGNLQQTHKSVATDSEVSSSLITKYHHDMIRRASNSIELIPRHEREISATCISISPKNVELVKRMVRDFRRQLLALSMEDDQAELVYQLNFQFFPLVGHSAPKNISEDGQ